MSSLIKRGYLLICVVVIFFVFDSCKKGPEDPFFSFRSRKDRVAGDWKISSFKSEILYTTGLTQPQKAKITTTIDGENITIQVDSIETQHDTTKIWKGTIKDCEYRFDKNSKMTHLLKYEIIDAKEKIDEETGIRTEEKIITTYEIKGSGTWNFLGNVEKNGIEKYKNKERISLIYEYYYVKIDSIYQKFVYDEEGNIIGNQTEYWASQNVLANGYANGRRAEIWRIRDLRNNKIVMEHKVDDYEVTNIIIHNQAGPATSNRSKGQEIMTLVPIQ
ncbi:MAG: hypothetical protein N3A01_03125 [Bacteroidales bacterium]|nr:hypothetical protein [Bacteroidales bacterium]